MPQKFDGTTRLRRGALVPLAASLLAIAPAAWSQTRMDTSFSGYGTVGFASTDTNDAEFRQGIHQEHGAKRNPDFFVDSRVGVQGQMNWENKLSLTAQVLASRRGEKGLSPTIEWLFAQYNPTPDVDLRLGRLVLPVFLASDTRNVGYSQPWLRAPQLVYSQAPTTYMDGLQATWRSSIGDSVLSVQPMIGTLRNQTVYEPFTFVPEYKLDIDQLAGINLQWEQNAWLARVGHISSRGEAMNPYYNPFDPFSQPGPLTTKDKFTSFGLQYDNGRALVMSEFVQRRQSGNQAILLDIDSAYVTFGWRFGSLMPTLTYSEQWGTAHTPSFGFPIDTDVRYDTIALGLRYAAARNMAVKFEWQRAETQDYTSVTRRSPTLTKSRVNVISAALDFVF